MPGSHDHYTDNTWATLNTNLTELDVVIKICLLGGSCFAVMHHSAYYRKQISGLYCMNVNGFFEFLGSLHLRLLLLVSGNVKLMPINNSSDTRVAMQVCVSGSTNNRLSGCGEGRILAELQAHIFQRGLTLTTVLPTLRGHYIGTFA